jgi:hypothetical protein
LKIEQEVRTISQNGNGHRKFFDPVITLIRLLLDQWEKKDEVTGEIFMIDETTARDDFEDRTDEPRYPGEDYPEDRN